MVHQLFVFRRVPSNAAVLDDDTFIPYNIVKDRISCNPFPLFLQMFFTWNSLKSKAGYRAQFQTGVLNPPLSSISASLSAPSPGSLFRTNIYTRRFPTMTSSSLGTAPVWVSSSTSLLSLRSSEFHRSSPSPSMPWPCSASTPCPV